ncbi:unnamed protein product [Diplocarpon coronariae]
MFVVDLSKLRQVEVCRVGIRCTRLKLKYFQTPTAGLGQWHTTESSHYVSISSSDGANTMGIRFKFSRSGDHQVVTDISFGADTSDNFNSTFAL